jgi:hypothetical protein
MKKIQLFIGAFLVVVLGAGVLVSSAVGAAGPLEDVCADNADSVVCQNQNDSSDDLVGNLVNTLLFVIGAISVLMAIIGGLLYVTSSGDSGRVTKAKNTLFYAIIGLVMAFFAYAIVNWVFRIFQ